MKEQKLTELLEKYRMGTCSSEELHLLQNWISDSTFAEYQISESELQEEMVLLDKKLSLSVKRRRLWLQTVSAAAILICCVGLFFYLKKDTKSKIMYTQKQEIVSGGNKATLTLSNGKKISLTDAPSGELVQQTGISITKTADGQIVYKVTGVPTASSSDYNVIETPSGGQFKINLPDGTEVWLNAASSLRFPAVFKGTERNVRLTGEAYFQVAKNRAMPFKVETENSTIEVLGTHFNVNAYANERFMETTLLEGSVSVSSPSGSVKIKPNQQAQFDKNNVQINVIPVDASDVIAWKNGYFLFEDESIERIMRKLARWYDVDVEYRGDFSKISLWGNISRYKNISEVLGQLELTHAVHFKIEGRRIIVMP
ncbi:FecR family protein [Pedobacter foliorum]|uniref:FecR family protein n=1 Tax=Pedobacter foliorum TaxID=2739058 RepID=UPI00156776E0|nr:FecR family protein [Pedobacter foliorum]NRF40136.1 FecR family protein [Pedobacter foliorum]